jgi:hypothetical protein
MNTSTSESNVGAAETKRERTVVTLKASTFGLLIGVCVTLCAVVVHFVSSARQPAQPVSLPVVTNRGAANATHDYWTAIIELDQEMGEDLRAMLAEIEGANATSELEVLCHLALESAKQSKNFINQVSQFPMRDVDEGLLSHLRDEMRLVNKMSGCLIGMADSGVAFYEWSQRTQPPEKFWTDLFESFMGGLMGRPFAGYEKAQQEAAQLDAEGQSLLNAYWQHNQGFSECIKQAEDMEIEELELRSRLAGKYGMEFAPRPDPAELLQ